MVNFLSLTQFKSWVGIKERLIPKQQLIVATVVNEILLDHNKIFKKGQRVKIIGRVSDRRYAVSSDLNGDSTDAILHESWLKDICVV